MKKTNRFKSCIYLLTRDFSSTTKPSLRYSQFVYEQLYHHEKGYFQDENNHQLGRLEQFIPFNQLLGYSDYSAVLLDKYPPNKFLTPSEIFRPFYGMTLANLFLQKIRKLKTDKLNVIEVGSGLGGNALSILGYLRQFFPQVYSRLEYSLVEISHIALRQSEKLLKQTHNGLIQSGQLKFINSDIQHIDLYSDKSVFVVFLEILDNLSHEKVVMDLKWANPREVWIEFNGMNEIPTEYLKSLNDEEVEELLFIWKEVRCPNGIFQSSEIEKEGVISFFKTWISRIKNLRKKEVAVHLPISFYRIVKKLKKQLPNAEYFISDFSSLPIQFESNSSYREINSPLISTKLQKAHAVKNYGSVLEPKFGSADIFYPTDFSLIKRILENIQGKNYCINSPEEFFSNFAESSWGETKSGYNPMIDQFANVRYLFCQ